MGGVAMVMNDHGGSNQAFGLTINIHAAAR
jgi:hypothetical protein